MTGKAGEGVLIRKRELWKLKDLCTLALVEIKEQRRKTNFNVFNELEKFANEILKKINEIEKSKQVRE